MKWEAKNIDGYRRFDGVGMQIIRILCQKQLKIAHLLINKKRSARVLTISRDILKVISI